MVDIPPLRLGTRGSPLALAQALAVRTRLLAAHAGLEEEAVPLVVIRTSGDRIQDQPLSALGGKGLFTKEIEEALLAGEIDLAVHSMKDVPTVLPAGLSIDCLLPREDPRDAFLSPRFAGLAALPAGARVGSSSLRRQAQLRHRRPDLTLVDFRGNVDTRLRKLAEGQVDATLLAVAGLNRLGLAACITAVLPAETMLPAVAQGAIGIERRADDDRLAAFLAPLNCATTAARIAAERAMLAVLDGSCRTPIAALAELDGTGCHLRGEILTPDGRQVHRAERRGSADEAAALGRDLGRELRRLGGPDFFR
ncbi:MAG: hydroxymethylbilane synthase [Alphaproteobacteria bacterium]|nr:hydroxymethylbilane synthase [Alphaproteobacteria bacterium]